MLTPELLDFIRAQHEAGMSREELEQLLLTEGGWMKADVDEAFRSLFPAKEQPASSAAAVPIQPQVPSSESATIVPPVSASTLAPVVTPEPFLAVPPVEIPPVVLPVEAIVTPVVEEIPALAPVAVFTPPVVVPEEVPVVAPAGEVVIATPAPTPLIAPEALIVPSVIVREEPFKFITPEQPAPMVSVAPMTEAAAPVSVDENSIVSVSPAEDFLGIFGSLKTSSWSNHSADKAPMISPTPPPFRAVEAPATTPAPKASSISNLLLGGVAAKVERPTAPIISPTPFAPLIPTAQVMPSVPPVQDIVSPIRSTFAQPFQTKAGEEPVSVFKFDFAKMRSVPLEQPAAEVSTVPTIESGVHPAIPSVGTESKSVVSPFPPASISPIPEINHELSAPSGRRTMAGDLLLQGLVPPTPIVTPPPVIPVISPTPVSMESRVDKPQVTSMPVTVFGPPLAEDIKRKNAVKRLLGLAIGGVVLLIVAGGVAFVLFKYSAPDTKVMATSAFGKFFDTTAFTYKGKGTIDLLLSAESGGTEQTGTVKFDLGYDGSLNNGALGYGDGVHNIKLIGELKSGDFSLPAYLDANVRIIASSLYFHLLSLPPDSKLDPELIKTYWIKIDLSEIAKELALSGIATAQEGYGDFGGQKDNTFNLTFKKHSPFEVSEQLPDEVLAGVPVHHLKMKTNGEPMLQFTTDIYKRFFGKELILTDDKHVRLRDGLAKIVGDVWINKDTGDIVQVSVSGVFDDDMFDVHVKGNVALSFGFSDFNKAVAVDAPTPILTLEELKAQMDQYQKAKDVRARDAQNIDRLNGLLRSLDSYKVAKGRYPTTLNELYGAGIIATSTIAESVLKQYEYESYVSRLPLVKANRCQLKGKVCAFYHIGTNLEDTGNALLATDVDITGDVRGADTAGCVGEKGFVCYDVVTPIMGTTTFPVPPLAN